MPEKSHRLAEKGWTYSHLAGPSGIAPDPGDERWIEKAARAISRRVQAPYSGGSEEYLNERVERNWRNWIDHERAVSAVTLDPSNPALITTITDTIYSHPMPDGDHLSVLIHCSDYIPADIPLADQLARVREVCADIARGVVDAILKGRGG